jgi:uncharacterized protein
MGCYGVTKDKTQAARYYRKAADAGLAPAQCNLGVGYYMGEWNGKSDFGEAAKWYHRAIDQGNARAMDWLSVLYGSGLGVPEDHVEAAKWERKCKEQREKNENAPSKPVLRGIMLETGE